MALWRNQEEILKLHTLRSRALRQLNSLALPEEEGRCVAQFHTCEMNADTRPGSGAERVECSFGVGSGGFGGSLFC